MKLYFLRHGQCQANLQGVYAAQNDTPLTDLGRQQAAQAGIVAKELAITRIFASDQSRAFHTAEIVAKIIGFPVANIVPEPRLHELSVGNLIGTPSRGLEGYLEHQAHPDGDLKVEPLAAAYARLESLIQTVKSYPNDTILLVGHSSSGLILQSLLTGDDSDLAKRAPLPNAHVIELPIPKGVPS